MPVYLIYTLCFPPIYKCRSTIFILISLAKDTAGAFRIPFYNAISNTIPFCSDMTNISYPFGLDTGYGIGVALSTLDKPHKIRNQSSTLINPNLYYEMLNPDGK